MAASSSLPESVGGGGTAQTTYLHPCDSGILLTFSVVLLSNGCSENVVRVLSEIYNKIS